MKYYSVKIFYVLLLFFFVDNAVAQDNHRIFENPRQVIEYQLVHHDATDNSLDDAALIFGANTGDDAKKATILLQEIVVAKALKWKPNSISDDSNFIDSITGKHRYYFRSDLPGVYLEKSPNGWHYSEKCIPQIKSLHKMVFPFGSNVLNKLMPWADITLWTGFQLWQLLGIFLLIAIAWVLNKISTLIIRLIVNRILHHFNKSHQDSGLIMGVSRPFSWYAILKLVTIFIPTLLLPAWLYGYVFMVVQLLRALLFTVFLYALVDLLSDFFLRLAARTENTLDDQLVPLLSKMMKVFVIVLGVMFVLYSLHVDVRPYLAGVSIGGLALALAAQDTIKNLFGSIMIFIDKPFQIGDWISFDGIDGMVEEVGFRSTRIRTFYNSLVSIPNGKLSDSVVDNYGLRVYRRFNTTFGIAYGTPPAAIEQFVEGLRTIVREHPKTRKDYIEVHLNELGDSSLQILFYIFFAVPNWAEELTGRHEILMDVIKLADKLGVSFAFPTQTLHIESMPKGFQKPQIESENG